MRVWGDGRSTGLVSHCKSIYLDFGRIEHIRDVPCASPKDKSLAGSFKSEADVDTTESRLSYRHAIRKIVSYRHEGKQYLTLTHDLGLDGMSLENSHPLSKGERLNVRLILGKQSIRLKGRAVESRLLSGMRVVSDIRFTGVSHESRRLLQNCLETLGSDDDDPFQEDN